MCISAIASGGLAIGSALLGRKDSKRVAAANQQQLDFAYQQYNDWKDIYGDIQTNLSDYYNKLDRTGLTAERLEAFEKEKTAQLTTLREQLEQRGISTSGLARKVEKEFAFGSAVERAKIRATADDTVAEKKLGFLQVGLGQNPAAGVNTAMQNNSQYLQGVANSSNAATGAAIQGAVKSGVEYFETNYKGGLFGENSLFG